MIAIEPWFFAAEHDLRLDPDGWTIRSVDHSRGVHVEDTIAVTAGTAIVLTDRAGIS